MSTLTKSRAKKPARVARSGRQLSATVIPLPAATVPAGPIDVAELATLGTGVDFSSIRRASENRVRRAR
jgi:hypothetical protein